MKNPYFLIPLLLAASTLTTQAQSCLPISLNQEVYIFPYSAEFSMVMNGASGGQGEMVPEGEPFDNPVVRAVFNGVVTFPVEPNTAYQWRARAYCNPNGYSDWSPVYHFVTPPPCPPTATLAFDTEVSLQFPAPSDPNIFLSSCGIPNELTGYVFKMILPGNGTYRLKYLDGSGGAVQSSINRSTGNYCRWSLTCLSSTSPVGTYSTIYGNAGDQINLAFSAKSGVVATRTVKLEYAPCPLPTLLRVDTTKPGEAKLGWNAGFVDLEISPDTIALTGVPDFTEITNPFTVGNLTAGATYHWQVRSNCTVNLSDWVQGDDFATPYACDSIPWLQCDSLYPGFKMGVNMEKVLRYKPDRTHELLVTVDPDEIGFNNGFYLALRDSALGDCFSQDWFVQSWPVYFGLYSDSVTLSLGLVEKGKTYLLYVDKLFTPALTGTIRWHCPEACPPPTQWMVDSIQPYSAVLHWATNGVSPEWEVEIGLDSLLFDGQPQYSGAGSFFTVGSLVPYSPYFWRVRQVCPGAGTSSWSPIQSFYTAYDCDNAQAVDCGVVNTVTNQPGTGFLTICPAQSGATGVEQYFRFTPEYDGQYTLEASAVLLVRYGFKPVISGCGAESLWQCLGWVNTNQNGVWPLGILTAGQTYLIALDFRPYGSTGPYSTEFKITCPVPCPAPINLSHTDIAANSATLHWTVQSNQVSWEIEMVADSLSFTGAPNFTSNQNSLAVQNLYAGIRYKWRVRGICDSLGVSTWSQPATFQALPDCDQFPPMACDQELTLHFSAGQGYFTNLPTGCGSAILGQEQIIQFTVDDANTTRYVYFPGNSNSSLSPFYAFYLKKAGASACAAVTGWQCLSNTNTTSFLTLNNLEQGATYFLLCKRRESAGADSLRVSFHCTLPCFPPQNPSTNVASPTGIRVNWEGGNGPWKYQIGLLYENGTEVYVGGYGWTPAGHSILGTFPALLPNKVHGWRVRSICDSGDTSAWTGYQYFKLSAGCSNLTALPCNEQATTFFSEPGGYHFRDLCTNVSGFGHQNLMKILVTIPGTFSLRINAGDHPAVYGVSSKVVNNCIAETWPMCQQVAGVDTLSLGNLAAGTYLLQIFSPETDSFAHTVELICPCSNVNTGAGVLFANGTALLDWKVTADPESWDIELIPVGDVFSGAPNFTSLLPSLTVDGLNPTVDYAFKVRVQCGAGQTGDWSAPFPVNLLTDCTTMPTMTCGDTMVFTFPIGDGLYDYSPCGVSTPGRERFFTVTPAYTGLYNVEVIKTTGGSADVHFGFLEQCDSPSGAVTCIGHGKEGTYSLGYLYAGRTYRIVADNRINYSSSGYTMVLHCLPLDNDGFNLFFQTNPENAFIIPVGDTCQIFTNRTAYGSLIAPDMTLPPSTWYDMFEHDVWFVFTAPASGTVQINVASDPGDPMNPQVALLTGRWDTIVGPVFQMLATGEDNIGTMPDDAKLVYTGLVPGEQYFILVDGAYNTQGRFCLQVLDEPELWQGSGCQTYSQGSATFGSNGEWRNLYAGSSDHVVGTLLGAIKTTDDLGEITVSTEVLPAAPVLPNGQKMLPRYFNIETEFAPTHPVTLRLFFTAEDLEAFNLAPPIGSDTPFELGLTHYDGDNEDCDPTNNVIAGGALSVTPSTAVLIGDNGLFYLEAEFNGFSEFGASIEPTTVGIPSVSPVAWSLQAYPNPADDIVFIRVQAPEMRTVQLRVFDLQGRLVLERPLDLNIGENQFQLPTNGLPSGMYLLSLFGGGGGYVKMGKR